MRLTSIVLVILTAISTNKLSSAQQSGWIPQAIENLQQTASSKTNFTFEHSMLIFASKLDPGDEDLRRVIAGVSGISVRNYHFAEPHQYDPAVLRSVKAEYRAAGWKQLVNRQENTGQDVSDLWVRSENNAISNVAILLAKANDVKFVVVSGSISPLDISHLGGHFGIPKIEGGVLVPNAAVRP
ncbi:MAG TPA: DUF4252 domain-containing protein [Candidatus Deferrimicrobiaceae bacterium]|jgi:hypothetical protein|nr:DUF4252 domain-containing protein [Candidatus Deferrimicrobiaceae bacterium]